MFLKTDIIQIFEYSDWHHNFRMPQAAFQNLFDQLCVHINPKATVMKAPVPLEKRVAVTLYKLASNVDFHDVANLFRIGVSTGCDIFCEVCEALCKLKRVFIRKPKILPEVKSIIVGFERKTGFPMCAGALDGTHIPSVAPSTYHSDNHNHKGWYSLLLYHTYKFIDFDVGWPPKCHDGFVFESSDLCQKLENGTFFPQLNNHIQSVDIPVLIVADS